MAIDSGLSYRLGFYYRDRDQFAIQQNPLSRAQAIQEVKENYDPDDADTDVFVALLPIPSEPDFYARDIPATEEAHHISEEESTEEEGEDESLTGASSHSQSTASATVSSQATAAATTPPWPNNPASQAAIFFPRSRRESGIQRQERRDAVALFTAYPLTAKDLWKRFHEPTLVESTMFDIWETGRRKTQGPEATRDMVRDNIGRMKNGKEWELQTMEDMLKDDD